MDLIIADRFQISHDLVWFSRQECEADMSASSMDEDPTKTTEDLWNELLTDLDLERQDLLHVAMNTPTTSSTSSATLPRPYTRPSVDYDSDDSTMSDDSLTGDRLIFDMEMDEETTTVNDTHHHMMTSLPVLISPLPSTPPRSSSSPVWPSTHQPPVLTRIPSTSSSDGGYSSAPSEEEEPVSAASENPRQSPSAATRRTTSTTTNHHNSQLWYALRQRTVTHKSRKGCARQLFTATRGL